VLLKKILEVDPTKRLTPYQILADPWMVQSDAEAAKVEVFNDYEKQKIVSEFEYYNTSKEGGPADADDPFLEQEL